jgi:hypothetical protein
VRAHAREDDGACGDLTVVRNGRFWAVGFSLLSGSLGGLQMILGIRHPGVLRYRHDGRDARAMRSIGAAASTGAKEPCVFETDAALPLAMVLGKLSDEEVCV